MGRATRKLLLRLITGACLLLLCDQLGAQVVLDKYVSSEAGDSLRSVANAGDVDGDGTPDIIVGQTGAGVGGRALVLSGATGEVLHTLEGGIPGGGFGWSVGGAGDMNGDGLADLIVGAPGGAGYARAYSGADGSQLYHWTLLSVTDFGKCVTGVGDWNLDGFDDVVVTAATAVQPGVAIVFSGKTGTVLANLGPPAASPPIRGFGISCDCSADIDNDGRPDLILGSYSSNFARVVKGGTPTPLLDITSGISGSYFGVSVAGLGDLDGDGHDDVAVGDPYAFSPNAAGYAAFFSGVDGSPIFVLVGEGNSERFGADMASVGDVDLDGTPDIAVSAYYATNPPGGTNGPGTVRVFSGADGSLLCSVGGVAAGDAFGFALDPGGDMDGDGRPELLVAASSEDAPGKASVGAAYVISITEERWTDLGQATAAAGTTPELQGSGLALPSDPLTLQLSEATPSVPGLLFVGLAYVGWPFFTGELVPRPDVTIGLATDATGTWTLLAAWPPGIPSGVPIYIQAWVGTPLQSPAASNALALLTP